MNMQRVLLPPVRIQRRCPWLFPSNAAAEAGGRSGRQQRAVLAILPLRLFTGSDGRRGCYGRRRTLHVLRIHAHGLRSARNVLRRRCGSADWNLCRRLFRCGVTAAGWHYAQVDDNIAIYNDFVPLLYGTAWYYPPIVFTRNDGNLTHMEVLLGMGPIQDVQTVLVNHIAIPLGQSGQNMTSTGWYNVISLGSRNGAFDPNFTDAAGNPAGDPYGSMAYLSVVVPNQINNGQSLPTVQVLADGLQLPTYGPDGSLPEHGVHRESRVDPAGHSATERVGYSEYRSHDVSRRRRRIAINRSRHRI